MGKQTNIKIKGTFENVIYYESKGEFCMREKPLEVKRVPVAIKNSKIFGLAARCSGIVRALMAPILPLPGNRTVMYRVNGAFKNWLCTDPLSNTDPVDAISFFNSLSLHPKMNGSNFLRCRFW